LVAQLVEDYEGARHTPPDASPHQVLRFLMDQHGLKQTDLAAEIGGQSVVSDILNGKRESMATKPKPLGRGLVCRRVFFSDRDRGAGPLAWRPFQRLD